MIIFMGFVIDFMLLYEQNHLWMQQKLNFALFSYFIWKQNTNYELVWSKLQISLYPYLSGLESISVCFLFLFEMGGLNTSDSDKNTH